MSLWAKKWKRVFNILLKTYHKTLMLFCFFMSKSHQRPAFCGVETLHIKIHTSRACVWYAFFHKESTKSNLLWLNHVCNWRRKYCYAVLLEDWSFETFFVNSVMKSWNKAPSACLRLKYMCWKPHETLFKSLCFFLFIHADLAIISSAVQLC